MQTADAAGMRVALLLLLLSAGGYRMVDPGPRGSVADPPIEIRIDGRADGRTDAELEARVIALQASHPTLRRHRTRRFEILSDLDPDEVAAHRRLLERTAHAVEDFREALGIDWAIDDDQPQLVIAFASQEDFIRFAIREDDMNARWFAGYFSPRHGHLVYHDARDHPGVRRMQGRRRAGVVARGEADPGNDRRDDRDDRLRRFISKTNAAVVVHEATHMLLHRRDILRATQATPLWLAEGLAGSFEPVEPERRFGPHRPSHGRTAEFRRLFSEGKVPSIRWLLAQDDLPPASSQQAFYAASAELCSWLVRQRPDGMHRYLEAMARSSTAWIEGGDVVVRPEVVEGDVEGVAPESHGIGTWNEQVFVEAFGDIDTLERDWHAWERAVLDTAITAVNDQD